MNAQEQRRTTADDTGPASPAVDTEVFAQFTHLFGPDKARYWMQDFKAGLVAEFAGPYGQVHSPATSRANIHQFCARAGLIGLKTLHEACLAFLETRSDEAVTKAAYDRTRFEAGRAGAEIDRQCALLT